MPSNNALTGLTCATSWGGALIAQVDAAQEVSLAALILAGLGFLTLAVRALDHLASMWLQYKQLQAREHILAQRWCPFSEDGLPKCDGTDAPGKPPEVKPRA